MGDVGHNCSICVTRTFEDTVGFLEKLAHRGPEATGIGALRTDGLIDIVKWIGSTDAFKDLSLRRFFTGEYTFFFGHGRYATKGGVDSLTEAHPIAIGGGEIRYPSFSVRKGARAAIVTNGQVPDLGIREGLETRVDSEQLLHYYHEHGPRATMNDVALAYTAVFVDTKHGGVRVMRDRTGINPGVLGDRFDKAVVASEDIAIRRNDASVVENLVPGAIYTLRADGSIDKEHVLPMTPRRCFFEWMYKAHPDSILDDRPVRSLREHIGRELAREYAPAVDVITYLPESPWMAARMYADERGMLRALKHVFTKRTDERSFLEPDQESRDASIKKSLSLFPEYRADGGRELEGATVLLIDDSIVRGTNSRRALHMLRTRTGVKNVYLASCTAPLGIIGMDGVARGCEYGVNIPPEAEFLARDPSGRNRSPEEVAEILGYDEVHYLTIKGMHRAYHNAGIEPVGALKGTKPSTLCTFCIGGPRPSLGLEARFS
ncbi:MAG: hypothetical protein ACMXYM_03250 [Candidatus Woesearchaeota archaeon]